jgi:DNA modification methylase
MASMKAKQESIASAHKSETVEWVAVSALKENKRNARTHSQRQIRQIALSIERFGFVNPVLIDDDRTIVCGHGRVAAARLNGLKEVPTLTVDGLSDAELRAYVIADNRLAEKAGWDKQILAIEFQGLIDLEFDIELTGFETSEIDILLEDFSVQKQDDEQDPIPACQPDHIVCRFGDLWILGAHRLVCGDACDGETYLRLMDGQKAQFVFTDPPYNVKIDGHVSGLGRVRHREFKMATGEMTQAQFTGFLEQALKLLASNSTDGSIHDICMDWRHMTELLDAGKRVYSELKNLCVWNKTNAGMGSFYRSKHELVFIWKNGKAPHINNFELGQFGRSRTNVWDYAGVNTFKADRTDELSMHPTTKPVAMAADAIKDCSRRGGIVLDPFGGSGTTCIACENTGRKGRLIEIDPIYCDVIIRRWQARTGKHAIHSKTKKSFEELEEQPQPQKRENGNEKIRQGKWSRRRPR